MLPSEGHHRQLWMKLNTSGEGIQCGYFSIDDNHKVHSHPFGNECDSLFRELITLHAEGEKNQIMVFIHGMWGNKKRYLHKNIIDFQKSYLEHPSANLFAIIWILWDGGHLRYKKNQACMHNLNDVSEIKDHISWIGKVSGHLYFRTSETVKNKIMDIITGN